MRLLLDDGPQRLTPGPVTDEDLARLYAAPPARRWLRASMVATVDGAAAGPDGRSGSINTPADHVVFGLARALSDAVLVGAGTVRTEGYADVDVPARWAWLRADRAPAPILVVVTATGTLPPSLAEREPGTTHLVTRAGAAGLADARAVLGDEAVHVCGQESVDLAQALRELAEAGIERVSAEGGPHLLGSLLAADLVDELDLNTSWHVVAGSAPRVSAGESVDRRFAPTVLLEEDGTVLARWLRARG